MDDKENNTATPNSYKITDYLPNVQMELRMLMNIERLLMRVGDIKGDEAFMYVDVRKYLANKANMLKVSEEARLSATTMVAEKENS